MKKPNKRDNRNKKRARNDLAKRKKRDEKNKVKRLKRWRENIDTKRADKETFMLEDEVRRIQAESVRESARMSAEAAREAEEITAKEYEKARQKLEDSQKELEA
jgi:hypothetical protein